MAKNERSVISLADLGKGDVARAGGKGANLGEMVRAGFPVPPGFVITASSFLAAMDQGGVRSALREAMEKVNPDDPAALGAVSKEMEALVRKAGLPSSLRSEIGDAMATLGKNALFAVRSSATSEDAGATSFAGMHDTYTNVSGESALFERIVDCWASLYGERVVSYRKSQGLTEEPVIAVVVQKMIASTRSGVIFTVDPTAADSTQMVIEAVFGLGEGIVSGQLEPDTYTVSRTGPSLLQTRVGRKAFKIVREAGGAERQVPLLGEAATKRVLSDAEALELTQLALKVEAHFGVPQDIEWAEEGGRWFLVQTRPITTLAPKDASEPSVLVLSLIHI